MLAHNGAQLVGGNVLTRDMRAMVANLEPNTIGLLEIAPDGSAPDRAMIRAESGRSGRIGPARDDMRIRAGAQCFSPQTRGQKIRN